MAVGIACCGTGTTAYWSGLFEATVAINRWVAATVVGLNIDGTSRIVGDGRVVAHKVIASLLQTEALATFGVITRRVHIVRFRTIGVDHAAVAFVAAESVLAVIRYAVA